MKYRLWNNTCWIVNAKKKVHCLLDPNKVEIISWNFRLMCLINTEKINGPYFSLSRIFTTGEFIFTNSSLILHGTDLKSLDEILFISLTFLQFDKEKTCYFKKFQFYNEFCAKWWSIHIRRRTESIEILLNGTSFFSFFQGNKDIYYY